MGDVIQDFGGACHSVLPTAEVMVSKNVLSEKFLPPEQAAQLLLDELARLGRLALI